MYRAIAHPIYRPRRRRSRAESEPDLHNGQAAKGGPLPLPPGLSHVEPASVLALQRSTGNQFVQRWLSQTAHDAAPTSTQIARKSPKDPTAPATLSIGASGPAVEEVQQHLNRFGASPPLVVDGVFGPKTRAAVIAFQTGRLDAEGIPLQADGVIGPRTWRALQRSGPATPSDQATASDLRTILAKGAGMSAAEAKKAKELLFKLKGDEFRNILKEAIASGAFMAMLRQLDLADILDTLSNLRQEVVIPTTLLKPAPDTIATDFKRANEIYNPHGVEIEQGTHIELSEKASKKLIGGNLSLDEFTTDKATAEELKLIELNRNKGRIAAYWVPGMTSSRGEALLKDSLKNLGDDRTSVVVNAGSQAQDTFPHEVGHALGLDHENSDANNLMADGSTRNISGPGIDKLTDAQLAIIRNSVFTELGKKGVGE